MTTLMGKQPVNVAFHQVSVVVKDTQAKGAQKTILHGVSGKASSGKLCAIMGSSGAGKSTLLDVLATNNTTSVGLEVQGRLLVNGGPMRPREFRSISCYVQQRDVLLCSATVREAITTSALLKLPHSMPRAEKIARVEQVIGELDLVECANTLIGDELVGLKGLSGGQKRRVSVGMELIKDPAVIFLDEPTSGLDSEMALSCMEALSKLARRQRTVVCTIHQPNSDITALFDDFMLLSAGHMVYAGPWDGAVQYFESQGFKCPMYKNPTDYFLSVVRDPAAAQQLWTVQEQRVLSDTVSTADMLQPRQQPQHLRVGDADEAELLEVVVAHAGTSHGKDTNAGIASGSPSSSKGLHKLDSTAGSALSTDSNQKQTATLSHEEGAHWWRQVMVLLVRTWRNWIRNPNMLGSELMQYVVLSLFVGLMYHGSLVHEVEDGVFNRMACIWFAFAIMCFTPSYTAVVNWDRDRQLLKRELMQRQFGVTQYYLSRALLLWPFQAAQCMLFLLVAYFFAGFQKDAVKFFTFYIALVLFQVISEGIGLLCAMGTRTANYGIITLTFVLLLLLSFSGFLVSKIPVYFVWVNKASYLTYAFAAILGSELEGLQLTDQATGAVIAGAAAMPSTVATQFSVWGNVGILAAQAAGMELLKLACLAAVHRLGWL